MITTLPRLAYHTGEDATSSRAPIHLDYWVGKYPKRLYFWQECNCRLFEQKYFNLKNLMDKIQSKISLRFSKYPVKVIHRNLENTWWWSLTLKGTGYGCRPKQVALSNFSRTNPKVNPDNDQMRYAQSKKGVCPQDSTSEICLKPLTSY